MSLVTRRIGAVVLSLSLMWMDVGRARAMLAPATMTDPAVSAERGHDLDSVQRFLERKQVQQRLVDFGMTPDQVQMRLNRLSDRQLHQVAIRIDKQNPAGDDGVVGLLLVVLIVLMIIYFAKRV